MHDKKQLLHRGRQMRVQVTFYQGGKTWKEVVIANNVQHAKQIAEARNPGIHIVGLNPIAG